MCARLCVLTRTLHGCRVVPRGCPASCFLKRYLCTGHVSARGYMQVLKPGDPPKGASTSAHDAALTSNGQASPVESHGSASTVNTTTAQQGCVRACI